MKQIAEDFKLKTGTLANTGYAIPSMIEDGQTLFDIALKAIDLTLINTGKMFVLWDDFGSLAITDVETAKLDLFVGDGSLATGYTYDQDIDSDTYNKIKLVKDNKTTGKRDVYIYQDSKNMTLWGILQDYETVDESMNEAQIKERGAKMLELYNRPSRSFSLNAITDLSVRAGRVLYIGIGAVGVKSFFLIEEATHVQRRQDSDIEAIKEQLNTGFTGTTVTHTFAPAQLSYWKGYDGTGVPEGILDQTRNRLYL